MISLPKFIAGLNAKLALNLFSFARAVAAVGILFFLLSLILWGAYPQWRMVLLPILYVVGTVDLVDGYRSLSARKALVGHVQNDKLDRIIFKLLNGAICVGLAVFGLFY